MKATRVAGIVGGGIALTGLIVVIHVLLYSDAKNGSWGFPLDDPWIHLQFARNMHDYGSYSYFKDAMVTSGSTSPLYTLTLALGFFATSNEMMLSYALGISFFVLAAIVLFLQVFRDAHTSLLLAGGAMALLLFDPRLQWVALSGMETTLFICLLLLAVLLYRSRNGVLLGLTLGLLVWTRPEALLVVACLVLDMTYHGWLRSRSRKNQRGSQARASEFRWFIVSMGIMAVLSAGYILFNKILSGSLLPNTYAAKLAYYAGGGTGYFGEVFSFLTHGHMSVLAVCTLLGVVVTIIDIIKRREAVGLFPTLFTLGMVAVYGITIPRLYQEGRYLMPVLPFMIYLGMIGLDRLVSMLASGKYQGRRRAVGVVLPAAILIVAAIQFVIAAYRGRDNYADYCKYISDRQVYTAHWIASNLPSHAVVATHDIGAIAYYSGRQVVDMVGLVSPDMITNIGSFDKLMQYLIRKKVTHIAVLRNWFSIVNVHPLFQTNEETPEIMEVFAFDPAKVHFMPQNANEMVEAARFYMKVGQIHQAGAFLTQALSVDPQSSRTRYNLATAFISVNQVERALTEVEAALALFPDYREASLLKAQILQRLQKPGEAIRVLKDLVARNPEYVEAEKLLAILQQQSKLD